MSNKSTEYRKKWYKDNAKRLKDYRNEQKKWDRLEYLKFVYKLYWKQQAKFNKWMPISKKEWTNFFSNDTTFQNQWAIYINSRNPNDRPCIDKDENTPMILASFTIMPYSKYKVSKNYKPGFCGELLGPTQESKKNFTLKGKTVEVPF